MKVKAKYFVSEQTLLTRVWIQYLPPEHHVSGLHNAVRRFAMAIKYFVVVPNMFGYPVWNCVHVTSLTPETLELCSRHFPDA